MEKIVWSDEFSVGVRVLDDQHKTLIHIVNKLIENPHELVDSMIISDALDEMTKYASQHFQLEEQLMEENGYPGFEQQKAQHKAFKTKLVRLCSAIRQHEQEVPDILLNYLHEWWLHHILQEDMEYRSFFSEKGIS